MRAVFASGADLAAAAKWAAQAIPGRPSQPHLAAMAAEETPTGIRFTGTDSETVTASYDCPANVDPWDGPVMLPGAWFAAIAGRLPKNSPVVLEIRDGDDEVRLTCGRVEVKITTLPHDQLAGMPLPSGEYATVAADLLAAGVAATAGVALRDPGRPALCCVRLHVEGGTAELIATDLSRAAYVTFPAPGPGGDPLLIPATVLGGAVKAIPGEGEVTITAGDGQVGLTCGPRSLVLRIFGGKDMPSGVGLFRHPDENRGTIAVDAGELREAVARAAEVRYRPSDSVTLEFGPDGIGVRAASDGFGLQAVSDLVTGQWVGEPLGIYVNPGYLTDALAGLRQVRIGAAQTRPSLPPAIIVTGLDDGGWKEHHAVQPIQIPAAVKAA